MTQKHMPWFLLCASVAMVTSMIGSEIDYHHKIPADCHRSYEEVQNDFPAHRLLCAAHAYARGCSARDGSVGSADCCFGLWRLSVETKNPEIVALCHRYVDSGDCEYQPSEKEP